ncbi:MAG TPA: hypothetical protein VND01_00620 [Candidatus Acidoferrales bacterium]|nr:hypothetical protein [Candidatus Acidoferrales bacterium]
MKMVHGAIGGILALALNAGIMALTHNPTPATPRTITVSIYHGKSGNAGFEGVVTCHSVTSMHSGSVVKYHRCGNIAH